MTPIIVDSAQECQSSFSKVNRNKQILLRNENLVLISANKERLEDPSTGNLEFLEPHLLKIFLLVSLHQTWLKFRKSSRFGGTPGYIQMPVQASTQT